MFELSPELDVRRRSAALTQLGIDLYDRGKFDRGLAAFRQALDLDPGRVRTLRGMALCLSQLGRAAEARDYAERAVELSRDPGLAYATLGLVLHRLGEEQEAEKSFELAIKNTPDDSRVYYNFACYWAEVGREEKCREYLEIALELASESFAPQPGADPDLARYSQRPWFVELITKLRSRATTWQPGKEGTTPE
jgi:superkiller protein 3